LRNDQNQKRKTDERDTEFVGRHLTPALSPIEAERVGKQKGKMKMQQTISETSARGPERVERLGWTIKNAPGEFLTIHKNELEVDPAYQRNRINQRRVEAISRQWNWIACGCLVVALRSDNKWFVLDGQHRKLAADMRSDIGELPCLVFETTNRREEADGFLKINQGRVSLGGLDRYRAEIMAGNKTALAVDSMLSSTGHRAGDKPSARTVSCVKCLCHLAEEDRSRLERLWPLLAEMHSDCPMADSVVKGLWLVDKMLGERSVTQAPYREKLLVIGGQGLLGEIRRQMAVVGQGGPRVWACAIAKYLNKHGLPARLKIELN
jgi:hypothetical protein